MSDQSLLACPGCDLLLAHTNVHGGSILYCPRCTTRLHTPKTDSINKTLACAVSGLILFFPATCMPLMQFEAIGISTRGSLLDGIIGLAAYDYYFVALIVLITTIISPLLKLTLLAIISLLLKLRISSPYLPFLFRFYQHLNEWAMLEVYLIGILITVIKMMPLADIHYNTALFCFCALIGSTVASASALDSHLFWNKIELLSHE